MKLRLRINDEILFLSFLFVAWILLPAMIVNWALPWFGLRQIIADLVLITFAFIFWINIVLPALEELSKRKEKKR